MAGAPALVTGQPCEEAPNAAAEIAEQAGSTIPLVVGLTFAYTWVGGEGDEDHRDNECLTQVSDVTAAEVVFLSSCDRTFGSMQGRTRLCRADLRGGAIYRTATGPMIPDLVTGSTMSFLSREQFLELRDSGEAFFRSVDPRAYSYQESALSADPDAEIFVVQDIAGRLRSTGRDTYSVLLNDEVVSVPVIRARALVRAADSSDSESEVELVVLDDERTPVVLDHQRPASGFSIRFNRITWPERSAIERDLAEKRESTIYGIYFDYNSAEIRVESEVTLKEIATALAAHPDWVLSIDGHTDSIGGAAFNLDLSRRRSEAVRAVLVDRYGVAAARLTTSGSGDSRPVDTNDTPEGRTRNRRVELRRL